MRKSYALLYVLLVLLASCRVMPGIDTHELQPVDINRHDTALSGWMFADLKGDEVDYFIGRDTSLPGIHSIYVEDLKGKVISQINSTSPFRSVECVVNPTDNSRWLFYSYNDQKTVYLDAAKYDWQIPLKRESKKFEPILRNDEAISNPKIEYFGQITPQFMEDIDKDGKIELVCLANDGFTANPRGIVVYDFASGKIKWKFDSPSNLTAIHFDDFDGDGNKELISSNYAFKNTSKEIHGLNDASGWIVVLSVKGELLYSENTFEGFGQVTVDHADTDEDGIMEIFALNTSWGSETYRNLVKMYVWNGSKLVNKLNLNMASTLERYQYQDFMKKMETNPNRHLHLVDKSKGLIVLDTDLQIVEHKYKGFITAIWDIKDIDTDGKKEVLLQTDDDYFEILDSSYQRRARLKNPFPNDNSITFEAVRVGFEQDLLIAIGSPREIRYYAYKHLPLHVYLFQLYKTIALYLSIFLMLMVVLMIYRYSRRLNVMRVCANLMTDGLIVLTDARKIAFCNYAVYNLAEHSADPRCRDLKLCFPDIHDELRRFIIGHKVSGSFSANLSIDNPDKTYVVNMSQTTNIRSVYIVTLCADPAEKERERDKLAWADIARRLSHHVRRHITNILLALEALKKDQDEGRHELYEVIGEEIDKVRVFTHAFQRFTELKNYSLQLQDVIPSVEHSLARVKLPSNVKLVKNWYLRSVEAYIEPIRFEEAVTNAITNALEAMPEGGVLHITVKAFPKDSSPKGELSVLVEIEDNGCGIPKKYMEEIWKPFFTTNQSGTGIGIPETKKIIDSMSGIMDIQSEEGMGTTVSFWLKGE